MKVNSDTWVCAKETAQSIIGHKERYLDVEKLTKVPWKLIAILHYRESGCDFNTYLGNGQRLDRVTTIVPKGRGPFSSFKEGAIDALRLEGMLQQTKWEIEHILFYAHKFNGFAKVYGANTPYLWSGTQHYTKGKFIADGEFDENAVDSQLGCALILAAINYLESKEQKPVVKPGFTQFFDKYYDISIYVMGVLTGLALYGIYNNYYFNAIGCVFGQ
jgi:lysozyme family protein